LQGLKLPGKPLPSFSWMITLTLLLKQCYGEGIFMTV